MNRLGLTARVVHDVSECSERDLVVVDTSAVIHEPALPPSYYPRAPLFVFPSFITLELHRYNGNPQRQGSLFQSLKDLRQMGRVIPFDIPAALPNAPDLHTEVTYTLPQLSSLTRKSILHKMLAPCVDDFLNDVTALVLGLPSFRSSVAGPQGARSLEYNIGRLITHVRTNDPVERVILPCYHESIKVLRFWRDFFAENSSDNISSVRKAISEPLSEYVPPFDYLLSNVHDGMYKFFRGILLRGMQTRWSKCDSDAIFKVLKDDFHAHHAACSEHDMYAAAAYAYPLEHLAHNGHAQPMSAVDRISVLTHDHDVKDLVDLRLRPYRLAA